MYKFTFSLFFLSLFACSTNTSNISSSEESKKLEILHLADVKEQSIDVSVISTGCTSAKDFYIESQKSGEICQVGIYRLTPDLCRKRPEKKKLSLPWDRNKSCGIAQIKIKNKLEISEGLVES